MAKKRKDKIVVIGAGNVGETIAYTLMIRELANEIVLIDLNEKRAQGSALDIAHGTAFYDQITVRSGGYEECADANLIIISAGVGRKPGQTRLELAKTNISIATSIARSIMEYADNPLLLVVSNPVDILTMAIQKETGLPPSRVIGTGTSLDTARLRYLIARECGVSISDVCAYVLGEHGDSQVSLWSRVRIGGISLTGFTSQLGIKLDYKAISMEAKDSGAEIIAEKGATYNGVAMATSRIVEAIVKNEHAVLAVSHVLGEEFGDWEGVAISVPCIVNEDGIKQVVNINMEDYEKAALNRSAETMQEFWNNVM
ncbi:L-lactate dehydrogenase [Ruminococcus sp. OA3]|uniref:L-lactate dehydrogenase n=1 Tax=Ruminococcus sp. OA3 TaxID=2914164 RepID=UPI001F05BB69|nr:L-lactate dehydrogenase [Ruminococcus sp. OA3]MCH1983919.1 L-lactate dehydrogenase [Ruminococcus sp. OA3]